MLHAADVEARLSRRPAAKADKVVVAVRAEKVVSKTALAWALTHVVHPGDGITLLAVFSSKRTGRRLWRFSRLSGDSGDGDRQEMVDRISDSYSQMVLQFHDQAQVRVRIKVVSDKPGGAVAAEASTIGANWVVLDKNLKQEVQHCMDELRCNIVMMKGSQAKVLRLNLTCASEIQTPFYSADSSPGRDNEMLPNYRMKHCTPVSSPEATSPSHMRTTQEGSSSSFDTATYFVVYERNPLFERRNKGGYLPVYLQNDSSYASTPDSNREKVITLPKPLRSSLVPNQKNVYWIPQNHIIGEVPITPRNKQKTHQPKIPISRKLLDKFPQYDHDMRTPRAAHDQTHRPIVNSSIRDVFSLGRNSLLPPPLCSLCQHKAPAFGKPPTQFSFEELHEATDGFSDENFLAEGGFGVVHRGVLRDGQVVAVKQLKLSRAEGDADFCREVRLLSCAQHRNIVLLIGFCIEGSHQVLVYEYICNCSLDFHLHGSERHPLDWEFRLKIAIGTARGLRYLHEDCRVGCIVHRDLRPHNILLTHDFEPMVADFGLARWCSEVEIGPEEQVIGTSGYLAPEYVEGGKISQKVDVYAFGVVLLELLTGRRSTQLKLYERQIFSPGWFHHSAAFESKGGKADYYSILDPHLTVNQSYNFEHQVEAMVHAASLCLLWDPESRPPMSKVLRVLEGGESIIPLALDLNTAGSRSGHLNGLSTRAHPEARKSHSRKLSH
ncbi:inactive protein kinase SELMODRAFT_444075-like [Punica granatum]|uniref:non-specific serine/threonine protein kinase n=2 Tax=Punica granatum TaxID=22663 RepID=A0A218WNR7_PUNGR|nr:inactive protein kinase SELMODRAFT_444075-like [Punica granatum]OWM74474.1 hypothetical protein CDL15_Pgr003977 [Punica granatum]PKI48658.1 hypothetical protein CRG98_030945 [Punica granatum]